VSRQDFIMLKYYFSSSVFLSILSISQIALVHADWKDDMLESVNAERAKVNLDPLCYNKKLTAASENHANDMIANDFFSHTGSDGSQPWDRMEDAGYSWGSAAENIAYGQTSVKEVMNAWMNSPGHKANILGGNVHFGAAWENQYWVQKFASPWEGSEVCDSPAKPTTCGDVRNYFTLKNEFCNVRANKTSAKYPKYWEVKAGTKADILKMECKKENCIKKDCCKKGRPRKCSNTGKKGQKGAFTQNMCGSAKTLKPLDQLKKTACTGSKGFKCTRVNCCE